MQDKDERTCQIRCP